MHRTMYKRAMMALNRSPESVSPQNEFYLLYYYCSNLSPPGWGQFWPQGYHMNRIDTGPNIIVQGQMIKALLLLVSEKKNFKVFFFVPMFQTCDPRGGAQFDPRGIIWTTLVEVHLEMLHTKYQSSAPSSFREEKFWSFPSLSLCFKLVNPPPPPPPGQGQFWPQGHHMKNLARGPLGDATYQISKLCTF